MIGPLTIFQWYLTQYFLFKNLYFYLFIFGCTGSLLLLFWAFSSCGEQGLLSSWGALASHCSGFSCCRTWALGMQASVLQHMGSGVVVHVLSFPGACRIFPEQESNPCTPHWQADAQPQDHQGSPKIQYFFSFNLIFLIFKVNSYISTTFFGSSFWACLHIHVLSYREYH